MNLSVVKREYIGGYTESSGRKRWLPNVFSSWGVLDNNAPQKHRFCPAPSFKDAIKVKGALESGERWTSSLCWSPVLPAKRREP